MRLCTWGLTNPCFREKTQRMQSISMQSGDLRSWKVYGTPYATERIYINDM